MNAPDPLALAALLVWGTLVGLDLSSWPQVMLSRPIVAGAVAGLLLGDPAAGLAVGAVMELFALDVLPIGASRYPDLGTATIGPVVLAAGVPIGSSLGMAVALGLLLAMASRPMIEWARRANARAARGAANLLAAGDVATVQRLQHAGMRRDALRAAALTLAGMTVGLLLRGYLPEPGLALSLKLVAVGGGVAAALHGMVRTASQGGRLAWASAGVVAGVVVLWWR